MQCLICGAESVEHHSGYDGKDVACPDCGRYVIAGSLISAMSVGYGLSIKHTREELDRMRDQGQIPILATSNARLLRLNK